MVTFHIEQIFQGLNLDLPSLLQIKGFPLSIKQAGILKYSQK